VVDRDLSNWEFDVAIVGGGPAGSTTACLLKKYAPHLKVGIFEREIFPRDHVGESQLPPISGVLDEIGCWDKVEAAGFPIKIGATYKWGKSPELWDFEFVPKEVFKVEPRPAKYEGHRRFTAFQVDRAVYDKILLDHAVSLGAEVFQPADVREVRNNGDRVESLVLGDGGEIAARFFIDATGHRGLIRRAMGVNASYPTALQNIAIWDYWENADWAVKIGIGGTRVQVISVPYGWIWFIPLGPTRTSVGLVTPADYYKKAQLRPADLYGRALEADPMIRSLMKNATSEGKLSSTKDWSFVSERCAGDNWFLVGESAGFADPILAAGLSMAQVGARELCYTILELDRERYAAQWLKDQYDQRQRGRIQNHIRFAEYWYSANAQFADLKEFTSVLAKDSGLNLDPDKAWAWLAQGGFIGEDEEAGSSGFSIDQVKLIGEFLNDLESPRTLERTNEFSLNLDGSEAFEKARYANGEVQAIRAYRRGKRTLPVRPDTFGFIVKMLRKESRWPGIIRAINAAAEPLRSEPERRILFIHRILMAMEAMILDGWIRATHNPNYPLEDLRVTSIDIRANTDQAPV
jgi:flavin-dependent dehydrogenase